MGLVTGHCERILSVWMTVLTVCAAPLLAANETPILIEGFEDVSTVKGTGQIKAVTAGPGLTQGKSAVELSPGAAVTASLRGADIARLPWLRLDRSSGPPSADFRR